MNGTDKILSCVLIFVLLVMVIPVTECADDTTLKITNSKGNSWSATGSNIQLAINDLGSSGGTVYLPASTINNVPVIKIPYSNIRIKGAGVDNTKLYFIGTYGICASKSPGTSTSSYQWGVSNIRLDNFSFYGRSIMVVIRSGCILSDLKGYDIKSSFAGIRLICPYGQCTDGDGWTESSDAKSENLKIINCHILRSQTHGFQLNAIKLKGCIFDNVLFKGCSSIKAGCWEWSSRNIWATGFDLAEPYEGTNNALGCMIVRNLVLDHCTATEAWESGFHLEYRPTLSNIVFKDCVSNNNGQKYFRTSSSTWPSYVYGAGYMSCEKSMTFIRCTAKGNAAWGWSGQGSSNSPVFTDCIGDKYPTNSQGNGWVVMPKGYPGGLSRNCIINVISSGSSESSGGTSIPPPSSGTEALNQQQTQFSLNYALYSARWAGQAFQPTKGLLTSVEIYLRRIGSPPSNVVLSVRSSLSGADLVSLSKPASQIPTNYGWVKFDISDLTVTPGGTYYLILKTSGGSSSNCYYWGYSSNNNPYANGIRVFSTDGGISWTNNPTYDGCFKTYGM